MKKFLFIILILCNVLIFSQQQVPYNDHGIANAKVGDYVITGSGKKIILTQEQINYSKKQLGINTNQIEQLNQTTPNNVQSTQNTTVAKNKSSFQTFLWGTYNGPQGNIILILIALVGFSIVANFIGSLLGLLKIIISILVVIVWIYFIFEYGFLPILFSILLVIILGFLIGQPALIIKIWF